MEFPDPLQSRREALQTQYSLLCEKLMKLRRSAAIEADTATKFQLQKQIEQTETELTDLERRIDDLDRVSGDGRLYQALLRLGYRKQVQLFRKFVQSYPISAFLIHGKRDDYGQRWLLNRLVIQHLKDSISGKVIKIHLSRVGRRNDVAALWRELSGRAGLGRQGEIAAIVERVYQWWKTQHVLLILYEVDFLPESFLEEVLRDFWAPLATQSWQGGNPEHPYKLLMFLVDYDGCVGNWSLTFCENPDSSWHPKIPVKLPAISEFTESELANWLEFSADDLPVDLVDAVDETVQDIFENSDQGVPEPTFGEICRRAGSDWYENEDKWMKL